MKKSKIAALAIVIGLWITAFVFLESIIGTILQLDKSLVEFWPALMGPSLITLLGNDKKAEKNYYITGVAGILSAPLFIGLEHLLVPVLGADIGVLLAMFLIVALIIFLQFAAPSIAGPVTFIYFNAATVLTSDIITRSVIRIILVVAGTYLFLHVEHALVHLLTKQRKTEAAS